MSSIKLAILGAGSLQCSVPVIASLATYFGERPLDIAFYDADEESLDLFDRFARLAFLMTKATHSLKSSTDYKEALENAQFVVLQFEESCASKVLGGELEGRAAVEEAVRLFEEFIPQTAHKLNLTEAFVTQATVPDWPPHLDAAEQFAVPLQILRWLNGEEYPYGILRDQERSPLKRWLDDPTSLTVKSGQ